MVHHGLSTLKRGQIHAYPVTFTLEQTRTLQTDFKLKFSLGILFATSTL